MAHYLRRGSPRRLSAGSHTPRREGSPTVKKSGRPSAARLTATSRMVLSRGGSSAPTTSPSSARASASSLAVTPAPHDNHRYCTVPPSMFLVPGAGAGDDARQDRIRTRTESATCRQDAAMATGREERGCRKDRAPAATPSAHGHRNCLGTTPAADQKRLVLRDTTGAAFGSLNVPSVQAVEVIAARGYLRPTWRSSLSNRSATWTATVAWPGEAALSCNARSHPTRLPARVHCEAPGGSTGVTLVTRSLVVALCVTRPKTRPECWFPI